MNAKNYMLNTLNELKLKIGKYNVKVKTKTKRKLQIDNNWKKEANNRSYRLKTTNEKLKSTS